MRKITVICTLLLALAFPLSARAAGAESVFKIGNGVYNINGYVRHDVAPFVQNNRTYLPLRYVAYACGIGDNSIRWDNDSQTAYLAHNGEIMAVRVGSKVITVGGREVTTDAPAEIVQDRVMLPLRAVAEAFGCDVRWDGTTQQVFVDIE